MTNLENNPFYAVIDGNLYFICRGGKHIYLRPFKGGAHA